MNALNVSSNACIAAVASASGPAARGILRVSGSDTVAVLKRILSTSSPQFHPTHARRYPCSIRLGEGDLELPVDVHLWPTHRSFTGEPLAEIHCVGSPPLLNEILERIFTSGARPAERGEFTLRAFLAGRIDLVQAEAVLGVIDAANPNELKTALDQLAGGISSKISELREELLLHLADLEAGLDFVEEDIDFVQRPEFLEKLRSGDTFLQQLLQQSQERMLSTGHARVVLAGLPNAGKSTLFNALLEAETAIVSSIAGTTRDYLAATVHNEGGVTYTLIDTAGWESARDGIEEIAGNQRADQYQRADLIVWCSPANATPEEQTENRSLLLSCREANKSVIEISTKADTLHHVPAEDLINVSVQTGEGIQDVRNAILDELMNSNVDAELTGATAARCRESLQHAHDSLCRALEIVEHAGGDELVAMELRDVLDHLGRIVGVVYTDDILDRIFSRFCIGK